MKDQIKHPLHNIIGDIFTENLFPGYKVLKDPACGGKQNIPLFYSDIKSKKTEFTNVDLLIVTPKKIKVIIEIEEANIKPIQIFGKFLASALCSSYFDQDNKRYLIDKSVLLIQILDTSRLNEDKTAKLAQWKNIENSILSIIPIKNSRIDHYKIFFGDRLELGFHKKIRKELIDFIRSFFG